MNYSVSPPITTVTKSGTYALDLYETASSNPKALKILKATNPTTGARDWYYVEFRQAVGFDSILTSTQDPMNLSNILNGVEVRWGSEASGDDNWLLDMTPQTYQLYTMDPALTVGQSFSDPDAGMTITTLSAGPSGASVAVTLTTPTCQRGVPGVSVSPSSATAPAGSAVTYIISVKNNDGAGCAPASFSLQMSSVATGWTATIAAPTLTLSPGASTSTTLTVTSPVSAANGSSWNYTVVVTNINEGCA